MSMTPVLVLAQYWGDHMDRDDVRWWMPIIWLLSLAIVALAVVAVVKLWPSSRPTGPQGPAAPRASTARTILAERYARGELTTEELRERTTALDDVERGTT